MNTTKVSLEFSVPNIQASLNLYTDMLANKDTDGIHTGSGRALLDSLQGMLTVSTKDTLPMFLRKKDNSIHILREHKDVYDLFCLLMYQRNRAESARNLVAQRLNNMMAQVRNEDVDLADREAAMPWIRAFERYSVWYIRHSGDHDKVARIMPKDLAVIEDYFDDALQIVDEAIKKSLGAQ